MAKYVYQIETKEGEVVSSGVSMNPTRKLFAFVEEVNSRADLGVTVSQFVVRILGKFDSYKEAREYTKEKEIQAV